MNKPLILAHGLGKCFCAEISTKLHELRPGGPEHRRRRKETRGG